MEKAAVDEHRGEQGGPSGERSLDIQDFKPGAQSGQRLSRSQLMRNEAPFEEEDVDIDVTPAGQNAEAADN